METGAAPGGEREGVPRRKGRFGRNSGGEKGLFGAEDRRKDEGPAPESGGMREAIARGKRNENEMGL